MQKLLKRVSPVRAQELKKIVEKMTEIHQGGDGFQHTEDEMIAPEAMANLVDELEIMLIKINMSLAEACEQFFGTDNHHADHVVKPVVKDVQDLLLDKKMQEDQEEQNHEDKQLMKRIRAKMIIIHKVHESMTPEERKSYHSFSPRVIPQLVEELKDMLSEINMTLPTVIWHLGEADNDPETQAAAVQVQAMINKTKAPTCMQRIRVKRKRLGRHIEA